MGEDIEDIMYDAYLEVYDDGSCIAQLLDLPGCYAHESIEAKAVSALDERIAEYYAWLGRHDEYTPHVQGPFHATVAERVAVSGSAADVRGAFFTPDSAPVPDEDLDWALALLDWAYTDLFGVMDTAMHSGTALAQRAHTIADEVATRQLWLLSRLSTDTVATPIDHADMDHAEGGSMGRLTCARQASLTRLRSCSAREREETHHRAGEQWSLRKVLRRSILQVRMRTDELAALGEG